MIRALQDAARFQLFLLADLSAGQRDGCVVGYASHWIANLVVVQARPAQIEAIAARIAPVEQDLKSLPPTTGRGIGVAWGTE